MNVALGTVTRPSNPLGVLAPVSGAVGALITLGLWLVQLRPGSSLLGEYGEEIAAGGQLREDLIVLAGLLGVVAIGSALLSSLGGPAKTSAIVGILLGAVALTYPVMAWLDAIQAPVHVSLFGS
jgi:hypothetical protein